MKIIWSGVIDNDSFSILLRDKIIYVATAGSDDAKDWVSNLFAVKKRIGGGCRVHRGMHKSLKRMRGTIKGCLEEQDFEKVIFTGHSRAGATSQLCAWFFSQFYSVECYSFASPRIGNRKWVEELNKKVLVNKRYVIASDLVTKIPKINYFHGGTEIQLPWQKGIARSHSIKTYLMLMAGQDN